MAKGGARIGKRYARALFELCQVTELESMRAHLQSMLTCLDSSLELRTTMRNPAIGIPERVEVVRGIASRISSNNKTFTDFISLLLTNNRLESMRDIVKAFSEMIDELKKALALEITSAFPLAEGDRANIAARLERDYGSLASVAWKVEREIIGGLLIKSGDKLLDSSLHGSLEKMRAHLITN